MEERRLRRRKKEGWPVTSVLPGCFSPSAEAVPYAIAIKDSNHAGQETESLLRLLLAIRDEGQQPYGSGSRLLDGIIALVAQFKRQQPGLAQ